MGVSINDVLRSEKANIGQSPQFNIGGETLKSLW